MIDGSLAHNLTRTHCAHRGHANAAFTRCDGFIATLLTRSCI